MPSLKKKLADTVAELGALVVSRYMIPKFNEVQSTDAIPGRGREEGIGEQCRTHHRGQGGYCPGQDGGAGSLVRNSFNLLPKSIATKEMDM